MSQADRDLIQSGVERRLAAVEAFIPSRPAWRPADDRDVRPAHIRVVAGPALRRESSGGRRLGLLLAVGAVAGLMLAYGLAGGGAPPTVSPSGPIASPTATATAGPTQAGWLRPAVEPRLLIPVRPRTAWTVVEDGSTYLDLVYFLDDVGSAGYNVGLSEIGRAHV